MWNYIKKTTKFYKYGIPFLLAFIFLTFAFSNDFLSMKGFYMKYYEVIGEVVILSFCYREFFEAFRRHKCKWQVASICGVVTHCILNIVYYTNGKNEAILDYQYAGFWMWCGIVLIYLYKDYATGED